jgi:hypothetical protein
VSASNEKAVYPNCALISATFERGRSLIRNFAIKTKDGYKRYQRYQRKKERIVQEV